MVISYYEVKVEVKDEAVEKNLKRLINQIYKLLPMREEGKDWKKPLSTIFIELSGMCDILPDLHDKLLSLLSKLEGISKLDENGSFDMYRGTIFECISLLDKIIKECQQ